jgi:hypothetical protein
MLPEQPAEPPQPDRVGAAERPGQQLSGDILGQAMGVKGASDQP